MKAWIALAAIAVVGLLIFALRANAISLDEARHRAWGNYQASLQRRNDLIPNLVETVKGYAAHEQETLQAVVEARTRLLQIDPKGAAENADQQRKLIEANQQLSGALQRLMLVVERYPELKANASFLDLQRQLEGTENRVNQTRRLMNEAAADYNSFIRTWGFALSASFKQAPYFEAEAGAEKAPKVDFRK